MESRRKPAPVNPVPAAPAVAGAVLPAQAAAALERVLDSPAFAKSPSMRRLLRYLVENGLAGDRRRLTEYNIGVDALGKKPGSYSPSEDPSVRVQIGRLRERLRRYYGGRDVEEGVRFEIPVGSYVPVLLLSGTGERDRAQGRVLTLSPLLDIPSGEGTVTQRACGLREELLHRLFQALQGTAAIAMAPARPDASPAASGQPHYALEGSLRHQRGLARATMRLIDRRTDRLLWSGQFDQRADAGGGDALRMQEALAAAICLHLMREVFDAAGPAGVATGPARAS